MVASALRTEQFTFGVKNARWREICIIYPGAISRSSVAWTAASIILYIKHSEVCRQIAKMLEQTWTLC